MFSHYIGGFTLSHKTLYNNILAAVCVIRIAGKPYKPHFLIGKLRNLIVEASYI